MIYGHSSLVLVLTSEEIIQVKKIVLIGLFMMCVTGSAIAGGLKIGVVSVERILTKAPQVEAVNTRMLEKFGPKRDELKKMEKDLQALQEKYKRNELVMTEDKLNDMKKKIIRKIQILKQKEMMLTQEISTMRNKELAKLQKSIRAIITKIAKKDKYSLVLSDGVVYANKKLDITDKVLDKMKADFKKDK